MCEDKQASSHYLFFDVLIMNDNRFSQAFLQYCRDARLCACQNQGQVWTWNNGCIHTININ